MTIEEALENNSNLEFPIPLDTVYYEICEEIDIRNQTTLDVFSNILVEEDDISILDYIKTNLNKTIFLNKEYAYNKLIKI